MVGQNIQSQEKAPHIPEKARCWAEIDLEQLKANLRVYQAQLPAGSEIMAVVKANAYGHGDQAIAQALYGQGIRRFAVATVQEGVSLRPLLPEAELLILGYTPVEMAALLSEYRLTQALVSREYADALARAADAPIDCCYAIDTGMRRIGLNAEEPEAAEAAIRAVQAPLRLTGLFTHLCAADTPEDAESAAFTARQVKLYDALLERVSDLALPRCHCLNSAGGLFLGRPGTIRLGIVLYGLKPDASNTLPEGIRPVLSWKCRVAMVKEIAAGDTVGYGRTWTAPEKRRIATLTVGYADGYSRLLSNRGWVLLHGRRAPIVGRVCMDQTMVDVTDIPDTKMGDTAILLGSNGTETLTADDMAALTGTIGYEIVCDISERVPRLPVSRPALNDIKRHVAQLEQSGLRTPVWEYLTEQYRADPDQPELATLVMQQMVFYLDELEGITQASAPERDHEYADYVALLQEILANAESRYFGCEYFLWQLYYWLHGGATYHWLWGRTIPVSDTAAWLEKIRSQAERICDDPVVFRWVEALYSRDVVSMGRISRARLHARTERWDLQNNIADDEAKYDLESWECYLSE